METKDTMTAEQWQLFIRKEEPEPPTIFYCGKTYEQLENEANAKQKKKWKPKKFTAKQKKEMEAQREFHRGLAATRANQKRIDAKYKEIFRLRREKAKQEQEATRQFHDTLPILDVTVEAKQLN